MVSASIPVVLRTVSVNGAFSTFLQESVRLDPQQVATARSSRDWLHDQIAGFPDHVQDFPRLWSEKTINFGSFARGTKIRPLDDIDLMICMMGEGATYEELYGGRIQINLPTTGRLRVLSNDGRTLNSTRVLNALRAAVGSVPQYQASDLHRHGEAVVLDLKSYPWSFDIVPAFFTAPESSGRDYYLIPDGVGTWKKTDPRVDRQRIWTANQKHEGRALDLIRLVKHWNRRPTMTTAPSYLIEAIVLDLLEQRRDRVLSKFPDLDIEEALRHVADAVLLPVDDPKGIQGDINTLTYAQRVSIRSRALGDAQRAQEASALEMQGDSDGAIDLWRRVFGPAFAGAR